MSDDIRPWLECLELGQYAETFEANDIDLRSLAYLSDEDLKGLGVSLGHRRILLAAIAALGRYDAAQEELKPETKRPGDGFAGPLCYV